MKRKSRRFKITISTDGGATRDYYVYGRDDLSAAKVFEAAFPEVHGGIIEPDLDEWTTTLFEGRAAPGA